MSFIGCGFFFFSTIETPLKLKPHTVICSICSQDEKKKGKKYHVVDRLQLCGYSYVFVPKEKKSSERDAIDFPLQPV